MDNQSDKLSSARVVSDLIQIEGVSVLIGSWSSTLSLSAGPIISVKDAVQRSASSDPEEIKNALKEISNLEGAAGLIAMNEVGEPERNLIIKTIENGAIRSLKTISN